MVSYAQDQGGQGLGDGSTGSSDKSENIPVDIAQLQLVYSCKVSAFELWTKHQAMKYNNLY